MQSCFSNAGIFGAVLHSRSDAVAEPGLIPGGVDERVLAVGGRGCRRERRDLYRRANRILVTPPREKSSEQNLAPRLIFLTSFANSNRAAPSWRRSRLAQILKKVRRLCAPHVRYTTPADAAQKNTIVKNNVRKAKLARHIFFNASASARVSGLSLVPPRRVCAAGHTTWKNQPFITN